MPKRHAQTKEEIIANLETLTKTLGRTPNVFDINNDPNLPSSRQMQRRFGGVKNLRKEMKAEIVDYTTGKTRSTLAAQLFKDSRKSERDLYNEIHKKYHDVTGDTFYVERQVGYQQWDPSLQWYSHTTCDVVIQDRPNKHRILIDFFHAKNINSAGGCVRVKKKKIEKHPPTYIGCTYEVIFVCTNPTVTQEELNSLKMTMPPHAYICSYEEFLKRFLD